MAGAPEYLHVLRLQSDLLVELAVQGILRGLASAHAALRELPAPTAGASGEEQLAIFGHEHHADIGPEAVPIDEVCHGVVLPVPAAQANVIR